MRSWEAIRVRRADVEDRWSGRIGREHLQHAAECASERIIRVVARLAVHAGVLG